MLLYFVAQQTLRWLKAGVKSLQSRPDRFRTFANSFLKVDTLQRGTQTELYCSTLLLLYALNLLEQARIAQKLDDRMPCS
jgi:hypothetical protein